MMHRIEVPEKYVVVHGAGHLRLALDTARDAGTPRLCILSPPSAGCFLGPAWWRALMALAAGMQHEQPFDVLDCGDAAGTAMQALRLGQPGLVLEPASPQWATVQRRAAQSGALLLDRRPPGFDLAAAHAATGLRDWLAS